MPEDDPYAGKKQYNINHNYLVNAYKGPSALDGDELLLLILLAKSRVRLGALWRINLFV
ncbi:hypothetical protein ZHAS_00010795 [Anopheles sinensis]|uniref:Uncharacterized protein n=1 Tax=Anopheles sinensis TaxID=74873 RepID=A0A084VY83_ANOSI|nr:hypothetical protein ZHAS_00010795 [Anopheles sinensis]